MFTTLLRFDPVYYGHFKCNLRHIWDYPNLWNYLKELYQIPGVKETCNLDHIKRHYYINKTTPKARATSHCTVLVFIATPVDSEEYESELEGASEVGAALEVEERKPPRTSSSLLCCTRGESNLTAACCARSACARRPGRRTGGWPPPRS